MEKTKKFIEKARIIHGDLYDYSLVKYINNNTSVKIICPIHGEFKQSPKSHLRGSICLKCSYEKRGELNRKSNEDFINEARLVHGARFNYSNCNYSSSDKKVNIICSIHGEFKQLPSHHLKGSGCPKCGNGEKSKNDFIFLSKNKHGEFYDYSMVDFVNTKIKVKIICPIHGEFQQTPKHHYSGSGCPICNESKGEREIRFYLLNNKITFKPQHRFKDCKDIRPLPFDFYLPEQNICIEYDGEQHYIEKKIWGGVNGLNDRKRKDDIKTKYCIDKNITLIRLNETSKITQSLNKYLKMEQM